jgi:hypothetical protein
MKALWTDLGIPQSIAANYQWGDEEVDYAEDIFEGEISDDGHEKPGRDWIEPALIAVDPVAVLTSAYRSGLSLESAFLVTATALFDGFEDAINDEIYVWPRLTKRSTGEIAGSPRDIVDTGAFRDSQTMTIEVRR